MVALLTTAAVSALLAGCGGSGSAQTARSRAALLTTLENWSSLQTPVDEALGVLTQQCMAKHGYRYVPFPQNGQPGGAPVFASPIFGSSLWLGPQSLAWRIVNGWGLYEQTMAQLSQPGGSNGSEPQEAKIMQSMHGRALQAYFKALYGGGKSMKIRIPGMPHYSMQIGGCNTSAGTKLFGSVAASVAIPEYGQIILNGSLRASAARSPALHKSEAIWVGCIYARTRMKVSSPSQLFQRFYSLYESKGPTPAVHRKELAAAVADLQCQHRSRLQQTARTVALSAIAHLSPSVVGEIGTLLAAAQQARSRAQRMFAHPGTTPAILKTASPSSGAAGNGAAGAQGGASGGVVVLNG